MNDEPTEARASRRAGRAPVADAPRSSDRLSELADRVSDGQVLEAQEDEGSVHYATKVCVLCDYEEFAGTREEFVTHIREVHARKARSIREGEGRDSRGTRSSCDTHCRWLCSVCGAEHWFPVMESGKHGGPTDRSFDRRFAFAFCRHGKYPSHKRALGNIEGARGPVVFYHEGLEFSPQPEQDDPSLVPFLPKKKETKERNSNTRASRSANPKTDSRSNRKNEPVARAGRVG